MLSKEEMDNAYVSLRKAELMKDLSEGQWFNICAVREYVESIGGDRYGHLHKDWSKWHCVHYKDMAPGVKDTLLDQVNAYIVEQELLVTAKNKPKTSWFNRLFK